MCLSDVEKRFPVWEKILHRGGRQRPDRRYSETLGHCPKTGYNRVGGRRGGSFVCLNCKDSSQTTYLACQSGSNGSLFRNQRDVSTSYRSHVMTVNFLGTMDMKSKW